MSKFLKSGKRYFVKDSECPVVAYCYESDTKVLTMWWKVQRKGCGGNRTAAPYLYFCVPQTVADRLHALNTPRLREVKPGVLVWSFGTYVNTKVKKYPAVNLRKVSATDEITTAQRVSPSVTTRSARPS